MKQELNALPDQLLVAIALKEDPLIECHAWPVKLVLFKIQITFHNVSDQIVAVETKSKAHPILAMHAKLAKQDIHQV
jgi:hypothetical protein